MKDALEAAPLPAIHAAWHALCNLIKRGATIHRRLPAGRLAKVSRLRWRFLTAWLIGCLLTSSVSAQSLIKSWDRTYGGYSLDQVNAFVGTPDGGYLIGCASYPALPGDYTQLGNGNQEYWLVKTDSAGRKQWDHTWGGDGDEYLTCLLATTDGGYLAGGFTTSAYRLGDVSESARGEDDFWVVKMDARGNKLWDRRFGGRSDDDLQDIVPTADGGYLLVGLSNSRQSGEKTSSGYGGDQYFSSTDYWLVKIDSAGHVVWDRTLGGTGQDIANSVVATADGGFLVGGWSTSGVSGSKTAPLLGREDYWVVKMDSNGAEQWQRTYGAPGAASRLANMVLAADGQSALLLGSSDGNRGGMKSENSRGGTDCWLVSIAVSTGAVQWDRTLGTPGDDYAATAVPTLGGGWLLGATASARTGGDCTAGRRGQADFWLLRLLPDGQVQDNFCMGGSDGEGLAGLVSAGTGWVAAGSSASGISGDKTEASRGWADAWLVKFSLPPAAGQALLCPGGQQVLRAPAQATAIRWSNGATTPSITVTQPGWYAVTYSLPDGSTRTIQFTVLAFTPTVTLTGNRRLCPGGSVVLTADAPGATAFLWNTGATTSTLATAQPGTYSVVVTFAGGCTRTAQALVQAAQPSRPFSLGNDTTICVDEALVLRAPAGDGDAVYRWSDGSIGPTLRVTQSGTYSLQLNSTCETRTASRQITFQSCAFIPNVITPNNDGVNDVFIAMRMPKGAWALTVYDRWGKQVFHTTDYQHDWGRDAVAGVYFYYYHQPGTTQIYKGWVEVIR